MPLAKPTLANVSPGQPITAQSWNTLVQGILALFDGVNALGTDGLTVNVLDGSTPVSDAVVVGVPASGEPVVAVPPHGKVTSFRLTGLAEGDWTIVVTASGYKPATAPAKVPATDPVVVQLTASTVPMPTVVGMITANALASLGSLSIVVDSVLDVFGADVSKTAPTGDQASAKVLVQFPAPGAGVVAATAGVRLIIAAKAPDKGTTPEGPPSPPKDVAKETKDAKERIKETKDTKESKDGKEGKELIREKIADRPEPKFSDVMIPRLPLGERNASDDVRSSIPAGSRVFVPSSSRPAVGQDLLDEPREE